MRGGRVVVIGGGPAGMLAAGTAAERGAEVVLIERGPMLGRKLRLTGKGRCNLTNTADIETFIQAFAPNGRFLYGAFSRFFRDDLIALLNRYGVATKIERGGRVFPASDSAVEVALALGHWLRDLRVEVRLNSRARSVLSHDNTAVGVELYGGHMDASAVVVATGGLSYPGTGSTGDGYRMASEVGHTVVPTSPALAPLYVREAWVSELAGLTLKNVEARLEGRRSGRVVARQFGEMLFTHTGLSGPIILTLSRSLRDLEEPADVVLDLKPARTEEQLHQRFVREFARLGNFGPYVKQLLPKSLAILFPELTGISGDTRLSQITVAQRTRLVQTLKGLRFHVTGMAPVAEAIVTSGGVCLKEVDPRTMMSRRVRGLFFAGEILDLDAETGGFNLQAAFSTGAVAGLSAAEYVASSQAD